MKTETAETAKLEAYAAEELKRMEKERDQAIKDKGGLPYIESMEEGENFVKLWPIIPKDDPYEGRPRGMFVVSSVANGVIGDEKLAWSINKRSPLYREVVQLLPKAPCLLRITRVGTQRQDTRYAVKLEKKL